MIKRIGVVFTVILINGCTISNYVWRHPTKAENEFYADKQVCEVKALQMYPQTLTSEIIYGKTRIVEQTCITKENKAAICKVAVTDPPVVTNVDINKSNRKRIIENCIRANGWIEHEEQKKITPF